MDAKLTTLSKEHATIYEQLAKQCQTFAKEFLACCQVTFYSAVQINYNYMLLIKCNLVGQLF